jgi:hypothetical protein
VDWAGKIASAVLFVYFLRTDGSHLVDFVFSCAGLFTGWTISNVAGLLIWFMQYRRNMAEVLRRSASGRLSVQLAFPNVFSPSAAQANCEALEAVTLAITAFGSAGASRQFSKQHGQTLTRERERRTAEHDRSKRREEAKWFAFQRNVVPSLRLGEDVLQANLSLEGTRALLVAGGDLKVTVKLDGPPPRWPVHGSAYVPLTSLLEQEAWWGTLSSLDTPLTVRPVGEVGCQQSHSV